jgi:hypothetical protein
MTFITAIEQFQSDLTVLETMISQGNPDEHQIYQDFLRIQQIFQLQIVPAVSDQEAATGSGQGQPILTEMNRTLRLLGMDVAFLQTARQAVTRQQRQRQMGDRLRQLQQFCQGLRSVLSPMDDSLP